MASENSVIAVIRASRPDFRNHHDKVAFAIHAFFLSAGFSLIAVGRRALDDKPPIDGEEVGIDGWKELDDAYGFVYSKSEKGTKKAILVKCLPLEDYLMVDAVELTSDQKEPFHLQIHINDYLADSGAQKTNYGEIYNNLQGLMKSLNTDILEQLEPKEKPAASRSISIDKPGLGTYDGSADGLPAHNEPIPSRLVYPPISPYGGTDLHPGPGSGFFPESIDKPGLGTYDGSADGLPAHNEPMPSRLVYPPISPYGGSDLYPGPGAGFYPERGSDMGGGMLVGPNDPRFFGPGVGPGRIGGIPSVPPGARFDPYGPPDVPGFEPQRFVRQPRRPGGGVHPDLEHFQGSDYI